MNFSGQWNKTQSACGNIYLFLTGKVTTFTALFLGGKKVVISKLENWSFSGFLKLFKENSLQNTYFKE